MFRLKYFKAVNVSGFMFGLGKEIVELDLTDIYDKDVIVILGDNGLGKSVLLSLLHPTHKPTDKRDSFILEGKEGLIQRVYEDDDETQIYTTAIYTPKKDSHSAKLYFSVRRPGTERPTEMNPSGNVASYYELLNTYMGVTKDYVTFASYGDLVSSIVEMTDTERKLNVSSLIPNTKRFETTHQIIGEKYRNTKAVIQSISRKIAMLPDKSVLEEDVDRLEGEMKRVRKERDKALTKSAKAKVRLKEILGKDTTIADYVGVCRAEYDSLKKLEEQVIKSSGELASILCDITHAKKFTVPEALEKAKKLCEQLPETEVKFAKVKADKTIYDEKRKLILSQIQSTEKELETLKAKSYSIKTQDPGELVAEKKNLKKKLKEMSYKPEDKSYDDLTFEEAISLSESLTVLPTICQWLLEKYGDIFTNSVSGKKPEYEPIDKLTDKLNEAKQKERSLYKKIAELEQYRKLQEILNKRPADCVDDSCPFIANALQWVKIEAELKKLNQEHSGVVKEITELTSKLNLAQLAEEYESDSIQLVATITKLKDKFKKYMKTNISGVAQGLAKGDSSFYIKVQERIKHIANILSEKKLYIDITTVQIPRIDEMIELAKNSQEAKKDIDKRLALCGVDIQRYKQKLAKLDQDYDLTTEKYKTYSQQIETLRKLKNIVETSSAIMEEYSAKEKAYEEKVKLVDEMKALQDKIVENEDTISYCDKEIKRLVPEADLARYHLQQLGYLKDEEKLENKHFTILNAMMSIIRPGKGLWKEAIDIYMNKINVISNQVLRHTFDGELLLEPFILTDKSFYMPYIFKGNRGTDISLASSSQRATVATAIGMAIISEMVGKYSTITLDEFDKTLSPTYKEIVTEVLIKSMKTLGIGTAYVVTHNPENYEKSSADVGYILFPGGKLSGKGKKDYIEIE